MESGSTVASPSTSMVKLPKRQKIDEDEDMISNLPESLITHILSFLPTKDAVGTSVLSKRWINHWTSITKLDLNDRLFYSPKKKKTGGKRYFVNFVNRVLLLTKGSSMESCSLVIANNYDVSLVNTWISNILNRNIKNLRIHSTSKLPFSAITSHSLFKSYCLEELVLNMCGCSINIPPVYLYFGHLKLIRLYGIIFNIDSSIDYLRLPALKKFVTTNCIWLSDNGVILEAPLLEKVRIRQVHKSVSHEPRSCAIRFSALHMSKLCYYGYDTLQYITLSDPSSVYNASAKIILYPSEYIVPGTGARVFLLLKQFSKVHSLKFHDSMTLTQSKVADLHVFEMLSHLELAFVAVEVLLGLLQKSPVLKTIVLEGVFHFNKEELNSAIVPDCLTSTLQIVKYKDVQGLDHELDLAKFVMENGLVLERMSFSVARHSLLKSKIMKEFKEKLFSSKKDFSFTIIEFSYDY